jgi:hypothetical protein
VREKLLEEASSKQDFDDVRGLWIAAALSFFVRRAWPAAPEFRSTRAGKLISMRHFDEYE